MGSPEYPFFCVFFKNTIIEIATAKTACSIVNIVNTSNLNNIMDTIAPITIATNPPLSPDLPNSK